MPQFSQITKSVALIVSVLTISFSLIYFVLAWTEPTAAPPGVNVSAPLNVGPTGQSKAGGLYLNTGGANIGLIVEGGVEMTGGAGSYFKLPHLTTDERGALSAETGMLVYNTDINDIEIYIPNRWKTIVAEGGVLPQGEVCTQDASCNSGFCVDGYCCESACDSLCEYCNESGNCAPISVGADPTDDCADGVCTTGACDGAGSCQFTASGIDDGCENVCTISACDGAGSCQFVQNKIDCSLHCYNANHEYSGCTAGSGCSGSGADCSLQCYSSSHTNSGCAAGVGCSGSGVDCSLQCRDATYTKRCTAGVGCTNVGYAQNCSSQCYDATHTKVCVEGSGCSGSGVDCALQCYDATHEKGCSEGSGCSGSGTVCDYNCISGTGCGSACECDGTGYETRNINGDTVYVDCSTDKCWTPDADIPTGGELRTYIWGLSGSNLSCIGDGSDYPACNYCDTLNYGGFTDWVLPDKIILEDFCGSSLCSSIFVGGIADLWHWSSTEDGVDTSKAHIISFYYCDPDKSTWKNLSPGRLVTCVR